MEWQDSFTTAKINNNNRVYISKRILERLNLDKETEFMILVDSNHNELRLKPLNKTDKE